MPVTFLLVDQTSLIFLLDPVEIMLNQNFFPSFDISISSYDIHGQSLKLSEIKPSFKTFWPSQISGVQAPKNFYISYHTHPMDHHVAKFHRGTPFTPKATCTDVKF